jgi:ParB-like chromosome segregation protein Spo0J
MSADVQVTSMATAPLEDAAGTVRLVALTSLRTSDARLRPGMLPSRPAAGVDLPARVVPSPEGGYEIIDGFKRIDRWQRLDHSLVPVVVETPASPIEHKRLLLVANAPPRTITALDEARVVSSLAKDDGLSPKAIAKLLGHTPDWVERRLKLDSRLGPVAQQKLSSGDIGSSLACALTALGTTDQEAILAAAEEHQLSTRECTRLVAAYRAADDTDRRGLLADPLDVARPELNRQATLSSRAVALEQRRSPKPNGSKSSGSRTSTARGALPTGWASVVPDQAEDLLVFALPNGIADSACEGLEAVVTCEVQEARVPKRLPVGSDAAQDRGGHIVQHYAMSDPTKVREGVSQPFEQRRLPLVTEESQVELAREAQEAAEGMDAHDRGADQHSADQSICISWAGAVSKRRLVVFPGSPVSTVSPTTTDASTVAISLVPIRRSLTT